MKSNLSSRTQAFLCSVFIWLGGLAHSFAQYQFTTLSDPLGTEGTYATGISGTDIVGYYVDSSGNDHGFLCSGTTYTTLDYPSGSGAMYDVTATYAAGISGSNIVGAYATLNGVTHGYSYDGTNYTALNDPYATDNITAASGVSGVSGASGNVIVGNYRGSQSGGQGSDFYGFYYSGGTYITLSVLAGINGTWATGVTANPFGTGFDSVGYYITSDNTYHGFLNNSVENFTGVDDPNARGNSQIMGISGTNIVGYYNDSRGYNEGFICDWTNVNAETNTFTFTTLDDPLGTEGTDLLGISGSDIVGTYVDSSGDEHSFLASPVPEPSECVSLITALAGVAALGPGRRVIRRR